MSEYHPNKVRPMRPRVTWRRVAAYWPLLVWLGVVGIALWTYLKGVEFNRVNGLVDPIQEAVAADEDGRIRKILVRTGQPVKQGDPLVEMDTSVLDQQIQRLEAAIRSDLEDRILDYQTSINRLQSDRRELERDKASDEGELKVIEASVTQMNEVIDNQPTPAQKQAMRAALAAALARIEGDHGRLKAVVPLYEGQLKEVDAEIEKFKKEIEKIRDNPNIEELARANGDLAELQELKILRERSVIKSNHDGMVDRVDKDEGEFVVKADPILRVVANPEVIRAFLPEDELKKVSRDQTVWVSPQSDHTVSYETRVIGISPRVNVVPDTTSPIPNMMLHGREIILDYPKESNLLPGQRIIVHLEQPGGFDFIAKIFSWGK
jgi:multidrug resistance efflux pump